MSDESEAARKERLRINQWKYDHSEKGRARRHRYNCGEKGRTRNRRCHWNHRFISDSDMYRIILSGYREE